MSKYKRLLSLLLVVSSLFTLFCVDVHASDNENLVDPDLRNWEVLTGDCEISQSSGNPDYYYISLGYSSQVALVYDLTDLNLSDSYLLSFFLMNDGTARAFFKNYSVTVGVIVLDSSGETIVDSKQSYYVINSSNYSNFVSNPFELSFKMNTFVGKPAICFSFTPTSDFVEDTYPDLFYVKNISLVSSSSETNGKLDGILGWLQELWNSISDGFEVLRLSNTHLGDRIQTKLGEVITNLSGAFSSVGDRIQNKLGEVITGITGELRMLGDNLINSIRNFFIPSEGYFDNKINEMKLELEQNLGAVYQVSYILDNFFTSFNADVTTNVIEVPLLTVDLLGYPFSFGGWDVSLIPDSRLQFLADSCKFIIGVLTTFALLHGLRKKYDEIIGGGDN